MSTLRLTLIAGLLVLCSAGYASADPVLRPHDEAKTVVHSVKVASHEAPVDGVHHARPTSGPVLAGIQRVAILERPVACDSLLCPGYAMLGVGF